jgi:hypothetical protein
MNYYSDLTLDRPGSAMAQPRDLLAAALDCRSGSSPRRSAAATTCHVRLTLAAT